MESELDRGLVLGLIPGPSRMFSELLDIAIDWWADVVSLRRVETARFEENLRDVGGE